MGYRERDKIDRSMDRAPFCYQVFQWIVLASARDARYVFSMGAKKKPRIGELGQGTHMSAAGKAQLLKDVRDVGMPSAISASTIRRERKAKTHVETSFGPLICWRSLPNATAGKADVRIPFQHPFAMLEHLLVISASFLDLFMKVIMAAGSILRIVVYGDEVTPGQAMAKCNKRKTYAIYWSFADFGFPLLSNDKLWFTLATVHTETIKLIRGKTACLYREAMRLFFGRPSGADMRDGIMLKFDTISKLVFGTLHMLLADERAHKSSMECSGCGGTKICALCTNITLLRSRRLPDPTGFLLPLSEISFTKFKLQVLGGVAVTLDRLAEIAASGDSANLALMQEEWGWNHVPDGMLADKALGIDPVRVLGWDWMHCMVESGAFDNSLDLFIDVSSVEGVGVDKFHRYSSCFQWPKGYAHGRDVFASGRVVMSASEALSIAPIVLKFVMLAVTPDTLTEEVLAMTLMCELLLLISVVHTGLVTWKTLHASILAALTAFTAAYGRDKWKPKMHYILHLADQLRRHKLLIATYVHERKHRKIKAAANLRHQSVSRELGILEDVTQDQLFDLCQPLCTDLRLKRPIDASRRIRELLIEHGCAGHDSHIQTGIKLNVNFRDVCQGDVVVYMDGDFVEVGEVAFHSIIDGVHLSAVSFWKTVDQEKFVRKCTRNDAFELIESQRIMEACIFSPATEGDISQVILPAQARVSGRKYLAYRK